jgi:hypothetical protein
MPLTPGLAGRVEPSPCEQAGAAEDRAQALLDGIIEGPLHEFWRAKIRLERRLEEARPPTRGTRAGAEALRLSHALAGLFATPSARPLLGARTSGRRCADRVMSDATAASLERAYRRDPAVFSTLGD